MTHLKREASISLSVFLCLIFPRDSFIVILTTPIFEWLFYCQSAPASFLECIFFRLSTSVSTSRAAHILLSVFSWPTLLAYAFDCLSDPASPVEWVIYYFPISHPESTYFLLSVWPFLTIREGILLLICPCSTTKKVSLMFVWPCLTPRVYFNICLSYPGCASLFSRLQLKFGLIFIASF